MELNYPINLVGFDQDKLEGEVLTQYGEYLGTWTFLKDEELETGEFQFTPDGESNVLFAEGVGPLDSRMLTGLALSKICSSIRDWHEKMSMS